MSEKTGTIDWIDLTVDNAETICTFYARVVGWTPRPVSMGDYNDYTMLDSDGKAVSGICHARGPNSDLPAQWLPYFRVANLEDSIADCLRLGGHVVIEPRSPGGAMRFVVIRDPSGAVAALFERSDLSPS